MSKEFLIKKGMNKKIGKINKKKSLALGLSIVLALSFTGCTNKNETKPDTPSEKETSKKINTDAEQTAVSEYGYNTEYIDLPENELISPVFSGNTLFYLNYNQNGGIEIQSFDLSAPEEIKTYASFQRDDNTLQDIQYLHPNENGGMTFIYRNESRFSSSKDSLNLGDIPGDAAVTEEYLAQLNIDLAALELNFSEISGLTMGEFAALYDSLTNNENTSSETWDNGTVSLITIDADGNQVSNLDITANFKNMTCNLAAYDNEGNIYMYTQTITVSDNHQRVSGHSILKINLSTGESENTAIDFEPASFFCLSSGELVAAAEDFNTNNTTLKVWDKEKKSFSDIDTEFSYFEFSNAYPIDNNSFYYINDTATDLYIYNLSEKRKEEVLKFEDWDISLNDISLVSKIDDTHMLIYGVSMNERDFESSLIKLNKVKSSEIIKKEKIVLGSLFPVDRKIVADFNKSSQKYRIVAKNYLDLSDEEATSQDAIVALTKDLLTGNAPDLINLSGIDTKRYAGSGVFENLYTFINNDEEFKNKNLNKNILKLFEENDALYTLPSLYSITAFASRKDILGDGLFTLDKAAEIMAANPNKTMFDSISREKLLATLFAYNEDTFVDYKAKTCNFTDGTFAKILNLAKNFPDEKTLLDQMNSGEQAFAEQKAKEGSLIFYPFMPYDFTSYQLTDLIFNGSFNITGYPSVDGNKFAIYSSGSMLAICSQSKHKEACWEFIKKVFKEETENVSYSMGFPIDNDAFEAYLSEKSTPITKTDANGNEVEIPQRGSIGNIEYEFYAPSQEQVQAIRSLVDSVNVLLPFFTEGDIYKILAEETAPFYAGDKTAEDVCKVIQSRVNILINEGN